MKWAYFAKRPILYLSKKCSDSYHANRNPTPHPRLLYPWKMDHHLTPSHGATGRTGSKIDIFGHLAFGIYNRYHLNAQGCY